MGDRVQGTPGRPREAIKYDEQQLIHAKNVTGAARDVRPHWLRLDGILGEPREADP